MHIQNEKTIKRIPKINYEIDIIRVCNETLATQNQLASASEVITKLANELILRNLKTIEKVTNEYEGPITGFNI